MAIKINLWDDYLEGDTTHFYVDDPIMPYDVKRSALNLLYASLMGSYRSFGKDVIYYKLVDATVITNYATLETSVIPKIEVLGLNPEKAPYFANTVNLIGLALNGQTLSVYSES